MNLWNANCDSSKPRPKRELLHELDVWERSQGGHASNAVGGVNGANLVMKKDFDGSAWAANHNEDFQRLIAKARQKPNTPAPSADTNANPYSKHQPKDAAETQSLSFGSLESRSCDAASEPISRPESMEKSVVDLENNMMELPMKASIPFEQSRDLKDPIPQFRQHGNLAEGTLAGRPPDVS